MQLPPGRFEIAVKPVPAAAGVPGVVFSRATVVVGRQKDASGLVLEPVAQRVAGEVVRRSARSDVRVSLRSGERELGATTVNEEGRFAFTGVLPGEYVVRVRDEVSERERTHAGGLFRRGAAGGAGSGRARGLRDLATLRGDGLPGHRGLAGAAARGESLAGGSGDVGVPCWRVATLSAGSAVPAGAERLRGGGVARGAVGRLASSGGDALRVLRGGFDRSLRRRGRGCE